MYELHNITEDVASSATYQWRVLPVKIRMLGEGIHGFLGGLMKSFTECTARGHRQHGTQHVRRRAGLTLSVPFISLHSITSER